MDKSKQQNVPESKIDIKKLDDETEFIMDKFREGYATMELKQLVKNFIDNNTTQCQLLIETNEYKNCYFINKKLERVMSYALKSFGIELESVYPCYKETLANLLDPNRLISQADKTSILKHPLDISKIQIKNKDSDNSATNVQQHYDFFKYIVKHFVNVLNNIGVIYIMRNKIQEGLGYFARAIFGRIQDFDSYISLYQAAILTTNISFAYKLKGQFDEASHYLNKSILNLESLDKLTNQTTSHAIEICMSTKQMLPLLEILYNKKEKRLLPDPREIQREKMLYILAIAYHYYSELLQTMGKGEESKFCQQQFGILQEIFHKANPKAAKIILHTPQMEKLSQDELQLAKESLKKNQGKIQVDDNFSSVSFKTVYTGTSVPAGNMVSKDKIVFQKYMYYRNQFNYLTREIGQNRFKVIILQLNDIGCIQILLYSKPLGVLKKMVIPFPDLLAYSEKHQPNAFQNEQTLEQFFKTIIKKLYIQSDELHVKDIDHFQTIDDYINISKQI